MKHLSVAGRSAALVLLFACSPMANALTQDISAVFRPAPSKPSENTFSNTTPVSGYCADRPSECRATEGTLHFDIGRSAVEERLGSGARTYTGSVTVIWDSEV